MSAREAAKDRGDMRAIRIEARNANPIGKAPLSGRGATPSMGLSQFRGGAKSSEAKKLGAMLRKHVEELHGGAYADEFCGGFSNSDTGAYDGEGRESEDAAMVGLHYPESGHRQFYDGGESGGMSGYGMSGYGMSGGESGGAHRMPDGSMMAGPPCDTAKRGGVSSRVVGCGRRRRAPAGEHDGRRKRAEVVKQVMAEKGMKMIEASKYVKEHGLYKGGESRG